jgi:hypothetical protein
MWNIADNVDSRATNITVAETATAQAANSKLQTFGVKLAQANCCQSPISTTSLRCRTS